MKILVINAGSSSMKYQLINMEDESVIAKGNCERIGIDGKLTHKTADGRMKSVEVNMPNHTEAFMRIKDALLDSEVGVLKDLSEIAAVGHRIVQGGSIFNHSVLVDEKVIDDIEGLADLAPLHNHAHVQGIRACREVFGTEVPEVVVFDTAFHSTMPPKAYMFPIPYEYYEKYKIRRYGFHGTSHRYVSQKCAEVMGRDIKDLKIITCHLGNGSSITAVDVGNGSSITAVDGGKCVDTSMGLTPLDGFMMGTRTGTLDPSVVTYIAEKEGMSPKDMDTLLNKKSGLLGISGISSDDRDVSAAADEGNPRAKLAQEMLEYEIKKFIGAYVAVLNGVDAIVFTAGIGENQPRHREKVCDELGYLGVKIDHELNNQYIHGLEGEISTPDSKVKVYVLCTNEEIMIARDTKAIVEGMKK